MQLTRLVHAAAGAGLLGTLVAICGDGLGARHSSVETPGSPPGVAVPMSLRDDLLYAELMVHEGTPYAAFFDGRRVRVVLAVEPDAFERVQAAIAILGGSVQHVDHDIGYLRAAIPFENWPKLRLVDGVTVATIDGPLVTRPSEETPEPRSTEAALPDYRENAPAPTGHPVMTASDIAAVRRTTSHHVLGLSRLWEAHPTFDGRGVGIAILEPQTGNTGFSHPALQSAWDVTGRIVPKAADFLLPASSPRRVKAEVEFTARETFAWLPVGAARLPHAGTFRWGTSLLPSGPLPILWDATSNEVWIDVNRDLDYGNDRTLRDARTDPASSTVVPSVGRMRVTLSTDRREVRLHVGEQSHPTAGSSVAAGAERDGIAGTAPGARLIFVELGDTAPANLSFGSTPSALIEALLSAARHPDVDIISMAMVSLVEQPASGTDAVSVLARRIVDRYQKPIVKAAGNDHGLTTADTLGDAALLVGAFFPGAAVERYFGTSGTRDAALHYSSRGPRHDGAGGPDVIGPIGEPAASPCRPPSPPRPDRPARFFTLPACYRLSGGTSGATPAVAGLAASLLSGLKQQHRHVTADALYAALRTAARPLPDTVTTQGAGVPQADVAWSLLTKDMATVHLESRAPVVHGLQSYLRTERQGPGLYEREGWKAGQSGRRSMVIRRDSGPDVLPYDLSLTGDVASFSVPRRIVTHKGVAVAVPIDIHVRRAGVHAARLAFRDASGRTRTLDRQLTIVAADELPRPGSKTPKRTYAGTLREFESHYLPVQVPVGTDALRLALTGSEKVTLLVQDPAGRMVSRRVGPRDSTDAERDFLIPQPMPGTWIISPFRGAREVLAVSAGELAYRLDIAAVTHGLSRTSQALFGPRALQIDVNGVADIDVMSYRARTTSTTAETTADVPVTLPFTVEAGATLAHWRVEAASGARVHVYLYDCSTGTCARYDAGGPAAAVYTASVERPAPGRWMLAVTAGPRATGAQSFSVDFSVAATAGEKVKPGTASRVGRGAPRGQAFDAPCNDLAEVRSLLLQLTPPPIATPPGTTQSSTKKNVVAATLPAIRLLPCDAVAAPTMVQRARPQ